MTLACTIHPDCSIGLADDVRLRERLLGAGMVLLYCSDSGEIERSPWSDVERNGQWGWFSRLIYSSSLIARIVKSEHSRWSQQKEPQPVEALPGLWLAPLPPPGRSRSRQQSSERTTAPGSGFAGGPGSRPRGEYAVIVLISDAIFGSGTAGAGVGSGLSASSDSGHSEGLAALCQSARLDYESTRSLIARMGPAASSEVGRLLSLGRFLYEDHLQSTAHERAMESTGQQLAESYEEISLLYTVIGSMSAVQEPERFLTIACEELRGTLPYGWVGAQLCANRSRMKQLAGRFFMAGEWPGAGVCGEQPVRAEGVKRMVQPKALVQKLLDMAQPDAPMVLEPLTNVKHAEYRGLGNAVLVYPMVSDGEVIGVLAAGDKQGLDTSASNVDMKLLGAIASHMVIFLENAALYDDLNAMFLGTLEALTASIDAKDRYTCGHSQRVAHLTQQLARAIGLDETVVKRMHIAGLVHDVGKIGVPEGLLLKPGKLTDEEFGWIKRHPEIGYRILKDIPQLQDILPGVLHHHERWDGRGYPTGLSGESIPQVARLIGLADAFDAMSSTRTYRSAMDRRQVLREIERCAGTQFDPALVPTFVHLDFTEYDRMMIEHRAGGVSPGISSAA